MIGNINSGQFRKHPVGGRGLIYLKVIFIIGCIISAGFVIASIFAMFNSDIFLNVVSKKSLLPDVEGEGFTLNNVKQYGILNFKIRNAAEWLLMPRSNRLDLYNNIFSLLITWQLFKIANEINMEKPFYGDVFKRLQNLQRLILIGWLVTAARYTFVHFVIRDVTNTSFSLNSLAYLTSPGYLSFGTWFIVILFSIIYRKGVGLQREQDLTI